MSDDEVIQSPDPSVLPEGMKLMTDYSGDDVPGMTDSAPPPPTAPAAPTAPTAPPVAPTPTPTPSLASKLAQKFAPPPPPAPLAAPPAPEDPVAKVEAEMLKHNPKWKPAVGWEALKGLVKTESEKRAELEKKAAELETRLKATPVLEGKTAEDIKKLEAEHKSLSDRLLVLDLENHPLYQAQFVAPKQAELARAKELLDAHGVAKADVARLLTLPRGELGKAVAELVKDIPAFDQVEVSEALRKAYALEQSGRAAVGQARETHKAFQAQSLQHSRQVFEQRWAPVSAALGEHIVELEVPVTATAEERASIEDYNASLRGLRGEAEKIAFGAITEEAIAESAMKAAAYEFHIGKAMPRILHEFESVVKERDLAVAELKALRGRNPNHGIRATPASGDTGAKKLEEMNHAEAADYLFSGKGQ